jgi:DNA-binding response OmpR family regulator
VTSTRRILLAEPDPALRRVLTRRLESEGFSVRTSDGADAVSEALAHVAPDVLVVSSDQPSDFLPALRDRSAVLTVVLLRAGTEMTEALDALDAGADEFVVKPFSPRELVSRLHALLRRSSTGLAEPTRRLEFPDLVIDTACREVTVRGRRITLPAKEFELLSLLASSPREVFTREQLMSKIWGVDVIGTTATVTEHIRRLRNRIEDDPSKPRWIETVWSIGYRFNPSSDFD